MKQAAVAFLALMALQASAASLEEEMQRLVADATAALRTHEAKLEALSLDSAATEGDYRAAFGEYAAQREAQFAFLGWRWQLPLGVAILLAAVCGGLIAALAGMARMVQLRRAAKKNYKAALR